MRCSITVIATTLLAFVSVPGYALPISGTLSGDSVLTPAGTPGLYTQNLSGDGDDTTYGSFTPQSQSTVDFSKPPAIFISDGAFTETFSNGALFGTSTGDGTASGNGTATVTVDMIFTGGTGFFAGFTGEATATESVKSTSATTESITWTYTGTLTPRRPRAVHLGDASSRVHRFGFKFGREACFKSAAHLLGIRS